jgi:hypothetical protein
MIIYEDNLSEAKATLENGKLSIDVRNHGCPAYQRLLFNILIEVNKNLHEYEYIEILATERSMSSLPFHDMIKCRTNSTLADKNFTFTNSCKNVKLTYNEPAILTFRKNKLKKAV